jgi:phosphoglycolate phosphatase
MHGGMKVYAGALFDVTVYEGVPALLARLRAAGATLAVATSKPGPFAAVLAAHPGARDPVLVGDREHDVLGAAAHGLPCIGAGWGPAPDGELAAAGAAVVAAHPADVPAALDHV